jgi:hypothetical protein
MTGGHEVETARITQPYSSHIPIPYGCLTVVALVLGFLASVVASSLAIGIVILK